MGQMQPSSWFAKTMEEDAPSGAFGTLAIGEGVSKSEVLLYRNLNLLSLHVMQFWVLEL